MGKPYRDYADYLADKFGDGKVQKITINLGLSCPNRDGTIGSGGCIYCNNKSFSPTFANNRQSIARQITDGKHFFAGKYPQMRYLAYFQTYTSTHGNISSLIDAYNSSLDIADVIGIVIATRPDTMPQALLDKLAYINKHRAPVIIEYGAESSHDKTLKAINRCHTWSQTVDAVTRTHDAGIDVGLHFIFGLPGETQDMMLQTVDAINTLPVASVKFHQLQVIAQTRLAHDFLEIATRHGAQAACDTLELNVRDIDQYIDFCASVVRRLRRDIAIDRFVSQAPAEMLIFPRWGVKNHVFTDKLKIALRQN